MPIKVQCACGAAFAAKDELAGRTVKCPKCQQPLAIPAAGAAPVAAQAAPAKQVQPAAVPRQVAAPLPSQTAPAPHPGGDIFAEAGLKAMQAGMSPCPACTAPMAINAIVCIKCGYNKNIGRRMEVVKQTGGTALPGGHSVTVEEMLDKAAVRIEEEKEEERKKTREGMPWWVYLIGITVIAGFMIAMMLIPQETAMRVAGWTVIVLSWLVCMYSGIRILIIAFQESALQGILYLVIPFYPLFYIITRWDRCGGLFLMNLVATVFMCFGYGSIILAEVMNKPAESSLPRSVQYVTAYHVPIGLTAADLTANSEPA
ncbi:MAG: hypothetical protein L0211_05020 [Planctomycetaceae bacterium]|nr:hypothetical protein [Planctomycetaceae bacterium]